MLPQRPLQPGDELRCPHCGKWHTLISRHAEGTEYTKQMIYWQCKAPIYYAGQVGTEARFPTRKAATVIRDLLMESTMTDNRYMRTVRLLALVLLATVASPTLALQRGEAIEIGGFALSLGMPQDEALKRLGSIYDVRNNEGERGSWLVSRRSGPPFEPLGVVAFTNGRLTFASRQWANGDGEDGRRVAAGAIAALRAVSGSRCLIEAYNQKTITNAIITCGQREIHISAGAAGERIGGSVSESVRASAR